MANGKTIGIEEAEHECFILTVGSQDTSAAFISAFLNYVLQNHDVYVDIMAELETAEQAGQLSSPVVRYEETVKLPYFTACVQETLRLSPSVSMILPRYTPKGGMFIGGMWVPEGTELAANPYVIHRSRQIFGDDADRFRPNRWLENPDVVKRMNKYFFAFGYGSRRCLGKNIALFEAQKFCIQVRVCVAHL